jgi:diguanylate cyclase (GGDEF)-like protein
LLALFFLLAFFALPLPLSAQLGPHLLFRTLSIEQGLSQNSVLSIARDRFGFLWFGTESGLNKFDGYHFTVYIPVEGDPASISNSWINVLLTDRSGNLWIGTENGLNLYVYSTDSFVRYFHNPSDPNSLTSSRIFALYEDRSGRLWIGTDDGLNLFDRTSNRFTRYQYDPSDPTSLSYNQIRAITEDSHGFIWVGTVGGGLNRLDPATGRFTRIRRNPAAPPNRTLPDDYILSLLITPTPPAGQTSTAQLSPGQPRTLDSSNSTSPHDAHIPHNAHNAYNPHETLWIGTIYSGLVAYDLTTGEFTSYRHDPNNPTSISDNTVNCLALDLGSLAGATFSAGSTGESTRAVLSVLSAPPSRPSSAPSSTPSDSSATTSRGAITTGATVPPGRPDISGQAVSTDMSGTTDAATTGASISATTPSTPSGASSSAPSSPSDSAPFSIWLGTNAGGLCQFIPSRGVFISYRHLAHDPLSLADNRVVSLYLAPERILWVGTYRGISQLNLHRQNFMRFLSDPFNPASLSHSEVRCFYETPSGLLYVGTDGAGLDVFDQNRLRIKNYRHNPADPTTISSNRVFCLAGDRQGFIWAGTIGGGLSRLNPATSTFTRYRYNPQDPTSLPDNLIRSLLVDSHDRLWVGGNGGGLALYDRSTGRFLRPRLTKFVRLNRGETPQNYGIELNAIANNEIANNEIKSNSDIPVSPAASPGQSDTSEEASGSQHRAGPYTHISSSTSVASSAVTSAPGPAATPTTPATPTSPSSTTSAPSSPDLSDLSLDVPSALTLTSNPLLSGRIFSMAEDLTRPGQPLLWIASFGDGLIGYNPSTGEAFQLSHDPLDPHSLSNNFVISILVDHRGCVWVGTNGGGLCRLDPSTFTFTRYSEANGLPSSVYYGLLEDDDGYIWLSSNRGLSRLDPRTNQIKNFDTTDGLQSYEFNGNACLKGRNGYLYFGGINGFNAFNPREIKASTYLPPVVITNFLISNIPVRPGHSLQPGARPVLERSITETQFLELNWQHRVIAFEFAALDYTSPEKNQYAYILEGFDRDWNYVGTRRFASYSNLPPGRYTFRVRATNSDGLWNEAATSLSIRIIPPFWRTWWFYGLCVLALIGAVYGFERYRLGQARHRQHELERLVAQRTEELREANEKLQFLATTDELTGLANYRKLRDFLEYEWRRARRTRRPVSLIICDLDNFKYFNDTYGHQAGDECLKKVALEMFRCCQRSSDLVCRYGGDEFAVVLPETDESGAFVVAERIRQAIACLDLSGLDLKKINGTGTSAIAGAGAGTGAAAGEGGGGEAGDSGDTGGAHGQDESPGQGQSASGRPVITACLGVATMNPAEGGDTNELVARADEALYRAKSSGKNRSLF